MMPLSVLELATVATGSTPASALEQTTRLALVAEGLGYKRLWVAEHHGMPAVASSAPPVLIAHIASATSVIRIGSGGVMLPNHSPLVVAEQFGTLEALHPGRIDLGLGRAPGTDLRTATGAAAPGGSRRRPFPRRRRRVDRLPRQERRPPESSRFRARSRVPSRGLASRFVVVQRRAGRNRSGCPIPSRTTSVPVLSMRHSSSTARPSSLPRSSLSPTRWLLSLWSVRAQATRRPGGWRSRRRCRYFSCELAGSACFHRRRRGLHIRSPRATVQLWTRLWRPT